MCPTEQSHQHGQRAYLGERSAKILLEWLNSKARPKNDRVGKLLALNDDLSALPSTPEQLKRMLGAAKKIDGLVRGSKLRLMPVLDMTAGSSSGSRYWHVEWVPTKSTLQTRALVELLRLASSGSLSRIRRCGDSDCHVWFFARFRHQMFHSQHCQKEAFRKDPAEMARRRDYMRNERAKQRLQDQKGGG
jgi:hypothetical protein